jgi:hypothetical protein
MRQTIRANNIQSLEITLWFKDQILRTGRLFALRTLKVTLTKPGVKTGLGF